MFFHTVWGKTLRDYREAMLGWGIGLGALLLLQLVAFARMSVAARTTEAQLAQSFRFVGDPVALITSEGYATWHVLGYMPVLLGIWAVLAGARLLRGEEERGVLDVLLATPRTRTLILGEKIAALLTALGVITLFMALGLIAGEALGGLQVRVAGALLTAINVSVGAFFFGALALLLSQLLVNRHAAAGWAGALMVLAYLVDGTGRVVSQAEWVRHLSPLYYYGLSKPLIPSYGTNVGALALLLVAGCVFALAALPLFARRDIGGSAVTWHRRGEGRAPEIGIHALEQARRDIFGRTVGLRAFRAQAMALFWWLFGLAVFTSYVILITRSTRDQYRKVIEGNEVFAKLFASQNLGTDVGFIATVAFLYLPVMLVIFILTLAMHWPNDLESGRLELVLGTPHTRQRIFLERFGAVCVAAVVAPLVVYLAIEISAQVAGLNVDPWRLAAACLGIVPLELTTAAAVYLLSGWLRAGFVLGISTLLVALSFFAEFLKAVLDLPEWVLSLSIFHQYGLPLVETPRWGGWFAMMVIALALLALGALRLGRADIATGA